MKDKISIITPMYNSEEFIDDYFGSVLKQDYDNFEVIVVDDASSDKSWDLCRQYGMKDKRVKLLKNEKNIGAAATRNKALQVATGKVYYIYR